MSEIKNDAEKEKQRMLELYEKVLLENSENREIQKEKGLNNDKKKFNLLNFGGLLLSIFGILLGGFFCYLSFLVIYYAGGFVFFLILIPSCLVLYKGFEGIKEFIQD